MQSNIFAHGIVSGGLGKTKNELALLSGSQMNTSHDDLDYFHPFQFGNYDENGTVVEYLLPTLMVT